MPQMPHNHLTIKDGLKIVYMKGHVSTAIYTQWNLNFALKSIAESILLPIYFCDGGDWAQTAHASHGSPLQHSCNPYTEVW